MQKILKILETEIAHHVDTLSSNYFQDHGTYARRLGVIEGLRQAHRLAHECLQRQQQAEEK